MEKVFVILGNQLFPEQYIEPYKEYQFYMAEDYGLCTYVKHHKKKLVLFLAAMRGYYDRLKRLGYQVSYCHLQKDGQSYEERLLKHFPNLKQIISFEIEDKFFEKRITQLCQLKSIDWQQLPSPMFSCSRDKFSSYLLRHKKPFMKTFYQEQRRDLNILLDKQQNPQGEQWSFDTENRKKIGKEVKIPQPFPVIKKSKHVDAVINLVQQHFSNHPGQLDGNFEYGTDKNHYEQYIQYFLEKKLDDFGQYQDAISDRGDYLFHSILSPGLNLGLITPQELIEKTLDFHMKNATPLNSIEGFIRQIIGWREFVRGIYQNFSKYQENHNYWQHHRKLSKDWYNGTTGIPILDDAIHKAQRTGYNHHIERLMILGNMMVLCEIEPKQAHQWFMEMFIDSSDWVMGPNVYGMALFSDGGVFATKPYICSSNYWLKMSGYKKGNWCNIVDGLYWRFIAKHKDFFSQNPRLSMMSRLLDKMKHERKEIIFNQAERFLNKVTL
ncbi:MAG TPA: cryptochrome/photolyase family protein [Oligoflexia bacterium]|nr:cryptochrome/photolyase family protein [Oligoflexia bacterium]HMR24230.1 cryptochrome/photolyase family protein [Oligoflexia bacterium]